MPRLLKDSLARPPSGFTGIHWDYLRSTFLPPDTQEASPTQAAASELARALRGVRLGRGRRAQVLCQRYGGLLSGRGGRGAVLLVGQRKEREGVLRLVGGVRLVRIPALELELHLTR